MASSGLNIVIMREVYDKALFLVTKLKPSKKRQVSFRFTSKDDVLHITYSMWDDLIDIFYNDKLAYRSSMYKREKFLNNEEWIVKLRKEYERAVNIYNRKNKSDGK